MDNFLHFLLDINKQLSCEKGFWQMPHSPEDAMEHIEIVDAFEDNLCLILHKGTEIDKIKATDAYAELLPLLKNKPYLLEGCSAPEEAWNYACHGP